MANIIVDALGEACPIPVVKATKALKAMQEAGTLEVHVDNEAAVQNLTRLAQGKGLAVKSEAKAEKHFVVTMTVDKPLAETGEDDLVSCIPDVRGNVVVAIGSDTMGSGDDALGASLMKAFIYAVTQLEELPKTILFYNGGAKLTTEGAVCVEDLKSMETQGVEILTCGTCMDFYGLKDKLAVGSITNMYSIVEKLTAASKVVRP